MWIVPSSLPAVLGNFPSFRIVESLSSNGPDFGPFGKPPLIRFSGNLSEHFGPRRLNG